jgi:hypothetical protein
MDEPDSATLAAMFDSLSTRVDEMNNDMAVELANFDENLQANTHRLDDLFVMLQQIQQALPTGTSLPNQGTGLGFHRSGMTQTQLLQPLQLSQDVLSRWHWVSQTTVESIANSTFDIYELPKLHRDQTLRDRYIQKNIEAIIQPINGGKPQLLHAWTVLFNLVLKSSDTNHTSPQTQFKTKIRRFTKQSTVPTKANGSKR